MNFKSFLITIIFSLLLFIGQFGGFWGTHMQVLSSSIFYFLGTITVCHKDKNLKTSILKSLILLSPFLAIYYYMNYAGNSFMPYSIPIPIFMTISTIFAVILVHLKNRKAKIQAAILYFIFIFLIYFFGLNNYTNILRNDTQKFLQLNLKEYTFHNKEGDVFDLSTLDNKVVVVDFWTTYCGICFEKFPKFNDIYKSYQDNPEIEIFSLHIADKRDSFEKSITLLNKRGYDFKELFCINPESEEKMGLEYYPQYAVFDKKGKLVYMGNMNDDWNDFILNFRRIIDRTLQMSS